MQQPGVLRLALWLPLNKNLVLYYLAFCLLLFNRFDYCTNPGAEERFVLLQVVAVVNVLLYHNANDGERNLFGTST